MKGRIILVFDPDDYPDILKKEVEKIKIKVFSLDEEIKNLHRKLEQRQKECNHKDSKHLSGDFRMCSSCEKVYVHLN